MEFISFSPGFSMLWADGIIDGAGCGSGAEQYVLEPVDVELDELRA